MAVGSKIKNFKRIFSQDGFSASTDTRITNLENNVYKITYYEIVSGASGTITVPSQATVNSNEFGLSGNALLSKIDINNKPTYQSPTTLGGDAVTASLNTATGAWAVSGAYTDLYVALIYSINIKAEYFSNLNNFYIIETATVRPNNGIIHATASGTDTYTTTITNVTSYIDGDCYLIRFPNGNTTGCTLNINGIGAIPLYRNNDGPLIGGDIEAGAEMLCVYNYTANTFQCIGTSPNSIIAYVTNADSVTITKGQPVYAFGGTGDRMTVKRANNTGDSTSAQTVGLVMSTSIAANQKGFIMMQGLLDNLSTLPTSTWSDGDAVYLGATAGAITKIKPYAPNHLVYLGFVTTASNGNAGRMYVRVQNGYELDEIHDVDLITTPPVNDDLLRYNSSTQLWNNSEDKIRVFKDISIGSALTGTTAITLIKSILISANTIKVNDVVNIIVRSLRNTATGTTSQYLYYNTSASLTGATLMATQTAAMAYSSLQRNLFVRASNDSETVDATNSSSPDIGISTLSTSNLNIDWTQNVYIIQAYKNAAVGDSTTSRGIVITRFR